MTLIDRLPPSVLFVILTILFCAIPNAAIIYTGHLLAANGGYMLALMWGPAFATFATVSLKRIDIKSLGLQWPDNRYAWMGYLVPLAYVSIIYGLVWATGLGGFADPANVAALQQNLGWHFTSTRIFVPIFFIFIGTTGMLLGVAAGLGEEIGWRGFLGPRLIARFGFTGGAFLTGVIWTSWHVPIVFFADYHSATPAWFSFPCFFVMVVSLAFIMAWLRARSGSVWPGAILQASHNLFIWQIFTPLTSPRGQLTPYLIDEFGIVTALVVAAFALYFWTKRPVVQS